MTTPPQSSGRLSSQLSPNKHHQHQQGTEQVGQYTLELDHVLGSGNLSQVFLATDPNGMHVAVKVFNEKDLSERAKRLVEQGILSFFHIPPLKA